MDNKKYRKGNLVEKWSEKNLLGIRISMGWITISQLNDDTINNEPKDNFTPILIRESILYKNGFTFFEGKFTNSIIDLQSKGINKYAVFFSGDKTESEIEYIHELQNIHLFCSKQEIIIEE